MNNGKKLEYDLILLPEFIDMNKTQQEPLLHIYGIDIDNFSDEQLEMLMNLFFPYTVSLSNH